MTFFSNIYSWFYSLYGNELYQFLAGLDCELLTSGTNHLGVIGLISCVVTTLIVLLFYFIHHTTFNKWHSWMIVLFISFVVNLFLGFGYTYSLQDEIPEYHLYGVSNMEPPMDSNGQYIDIQSCSQLVPMDGVEPVITTGSFWLFGLATALISTLWYFLLSIVVKRFSLGCKHTPWRSLWP